MPVGEPEPLADAIASVLTHRERYPPPALRAYALGSFGIPVVTERIRAAYDEALTGSALDGSELRSGVSV